MNARGWLLGILFGALAVATQTPSANGQAIPVFGIQSVVIDPPSGVAGPANQIMVDVSGVASDALTPQHISLNLTAPGTIEILLTTPAIAGAQVPTAWHTADVSIPLLNQIAKPQPIQLPPGVYDFYARGIVGYGTASQVEIGFQQAINDFVVVPEPSALCLGLIAVVISALVAARTPIRQ
jgi:hypothetical protein